MDKIYFLAICGAGAIVGIILTLIIVKIISSSKKNKLKSLQSQLDHLNTLIASKQSDKEHLEKLCQIQEQTLSLAQNDYNQLVGKRDELKVGIANLEEYSKDFYRVNFQAAAEKLDNSLEKAALQYQANEEKYKSDYLDMMKDCAEEFATEFAKQNNELKTLSTKLKELRAKTAAAVEQSKRNLEEQDKQNYYRLQVPKEDTSEVKMLREIIPYLRDKEALNKVIWKVYYEKPYTDLIGRVVPTKKTGIYKITNITNNMCYVGQAVDIADRWKTHIKRGLGAEPGGRNKLYPVMYELGPENFTFEVIEVCGRDQLNEREDFWQDYFKAKEFGYSIK